MDIMDIEDILYYFQLTDEAVKELKEYSEERGLDWNIYLNELYREFNPCLHFKP